MRKAIGIDLGTTNSVAAFKTIDVEVLRNMENEELTRSCVGFRNGELLVGRPAAQLLARDPQNTVLSIKRLMGASYHNDSVQKMIKDSHDIRGKFKYTITQLESGTNNAVAVVLGGIQHTPEQISAEILKKLKKDAEQRLEDEVTHAVITVPAYFTEKQKNATKTAATYAGLKVLKLLSEPTAAAIAYGVDELGAGAAKIVLVYDFGGGTFDLSLLSIVDGQYWEIGTGGDRWLGGDDIDQALSNYIYKKAAAAHGIEVGQIEAMIANLSPKQGARFSSMFAERTEELKILLSSSVAGEFWLEDILEDEAGNPFDLNVSITRAEFEELAHPFIQRSVNLIEDLLNATHYDIGMVDDILLVGGTSCIPLVREMLAASYGESKIRVGKKPMLAVAEGAAVLAHRLSGSFEPGPEGAEDPDFVMYSISQDYFIRIIKDGKDTRDKFIEKQTPIPVSVSRTYQTTTNNQRFLYIDIENGVEGGKYEHSAIGIYPVEGDVPIGTSFVFEFQVGLENKDELLQITVYPQGQKNKAKAIFIGRGKADEKALMALNEMATSGAESMHSSANRGRLLELVTNKLREIERIGAENIGDDKWHEIYYTATERYEALRAQDEVERHSRENEAPQKNIAGVARYIMNRFPDLISSVDKNIIQTLITKLTAGLGDEEKDLAQLEGIVFGQYSHLCFVIYLEIQTDHIANRYSTGIGDATKTQHDIERLKELAGKIVTSLRKGQASTVSHLIKEAKAIISQYEK
jgi:molecular chaperone DnaK